MRTELEVESTLGVDGRITGARAVLADPRWSLYAGLVVLNLFDVLTTALVLERGGNERNPFVQPFIEGIWEIALVKALVLVVIAALLTRCRGSRIAELALTGTTGWYLAVVMWNGVVLLFM